MSERFLSDPTDQIIRTQYVLSWKIVVSEWRSVIAVSLNIRGCVRLIKSAKLYMCIQKHYKHDESGRTHSAGCARSWFRTVETLGERRYENWIATKSSVSFCLLSSQCQHLQSSNRIILYGNSGPRICWINFHTFTCTGNIAMCGEPDPATEKSCL